MTATNQTQFDLTSPNGRHQFQAMLISTLGEDLQGRLDSTPADNETDANQAEVQRRKDQERRHRQHLARVKELERDNRKRNPGG